MEIPYGYCHCGCGGKTKLATNTARQRKTVKGKPVKFIPNHRIRKENHYGWKGGRKTCNGRIFILKPEHPRSDFHGYVREPILIAEKALGKFLPEKAIMHHSNRKPSDNEGSNLIICQDQAYHLLLHKRMRALKACGYANWRKCSYCKQYDDPENLYISPDGYTVYHRNCQYQHQRDLKGGKL